MQRPFRLPPLATAALAFLLAAAGLWPGAAAQPDARTRKAVEAVEKILPDCEKAAEECARALRPLEAAADPHVRAAVDGARLRIDATRSVRDVIAKAPGTLIYRLGPAHLQRWREGMDYFLRCARDGTDPYRGMTSGLRTCRARTDGSLLFYVFKLPKGYDPGKRYPLDIHLHSGAGLIWRATWVDGKPSTDPARANTEERIWIDPCGRGNNSYAGMGEVAVMEVLADVKRHYRVDEDRVTVGGASMGGTGGFRLGTLYPDAFAAAHSLTGSPNYAVPVGNGRFDPSLLLDNLCNTPLCLWYEPGDLKGAANKAFLDGLPALAQRYAGSYPHRIFLDPKGGHGVIDRKLQAEGRARMREQKRDPFPKRVVYKTYCLRYDGAWWARLDTAEDAARPARIEAEVQDGGRVRAVVDNVDRFHLNLTAGLVGDRKELAVTVNGGAALTVPAGGRVHFAKAGGQWAVAKERYPAGLVKKHGLSGPVQDVFMGEPVLMVHGTREGKEKPNPAAMIDAAVLRLFGPGDGGSTLHGPFERKADRDVTERDLADNHLVLFGTPRQNEVVRKVADRLPVKFLADGVEVAGKAHRGPDVGLVMVYPNPLNPERYVLLLPENYGTYTALGASSTWTLPDWVVCRPVAGYGGMHMNVQARGHFDARWRLAH